MNVFRCGLAAYQDYWISLRAGTRSRYRIIRGKDDPPHSRARRCGQALGNHLCIATSFVQAWHQKVIKLVGLNAENRFFRFDQSFFHHVQGHANSGASGALAVACLQHIQAAFLDRELKILHIAIMLFQARRDVAKLVVNLRHELVQLADVYRRAYA